MHKIIFTLLVILCGFSALFAQTQLTNIYLPGEDRSSSPTDFIEFKGKLYFIADHEAMGQEIWVTDGTIGEAYVLKDIAPGKSHGILTNFSESALILNNTLYFSANDGKYGELWQTDGTSEGTKRVTDFLHTDIRRLTQVGQEMFFFRFTPTNHELWKSDGTAGGTEMVRGDFSTGVAPFFETELNGVFVFTMQLYGPNGSKVWRSDGTLGGTVIVVEDIQGSGAAWNITALSHYVKWKNDLLFVVKNRDSFGNGLDVEIIKTDGSVQPASVVAPLYERVWVAYGDVAVVNDKLYFSFYSLDERWLHIWETDGTASGTQKIYDVQSGSVFLPSNLLAKGNELIFCGPAESTEGSVLYAYDSQTGGLRAIQTLETARDVPLFLRSEDDIFLIRNQNDSLIFVSGPQLTRSAELRKSWISDLTPAGTYRTPDYDGVTAFHAYNEELYYSGYHPATGWELWHATPLGLNSRLFQNINTSKFGLEHIGNIAPMGNKLFFPFYGGSLGQGLWGYDWITKETQLVKDSLSLYFSSGRYLRFKGELFFQASAVGHGLELWKTDCTQATMLPEVTEGLFSSYARDLTLFNDHLYYRAEKDRKPSLVMTDGSTIQEVKTFGKQPDGNFHRLDKITRLGDKLILEVVGSGKFFLWTSDGTAGGTVSMKVFDKMGVSAVVGDQWYFSATAEDDITHDIWVTDGTLSGTRQVVQIGDGLRADVQDFVPFGNKLIFSAWTADEGRELWITDGTQGGTFMLKDIYTGSFSAIDEPEIVATAGHVFFTAENEDAGEELWVTDGTSAGTYLLKDIHLGINHSLPRELTAVDSICYFQAFDPDHGMELWQTDGQPENTRLAADIYAGPLGSAPMAMVALGNDLYFVGEAEDEGRQIWKMPIESRELDPEKADELVIFPNPASAVIYAFVPSLDLSVFDYAIFDMTGKRITTMQQITDTRIDISYLQRGIYILTLYVDDMPYSGKFVKN